MKKKNIFIILISTLFINSVIANPSSGSNGRGHDNHGKGNGNGHDNHGNGHGYGHNQDCNDAPIDNNVIILFGAAILLGMVKILKKNQKTQFTKIQ